MLDMNFWYVSFKELLPYFFPSYQKKIASRNGFLLIVSRGLHDFQMHPRISIRGFVCKKVRWKVRIAKILNTIFEVFLMISRFLISCFILYQIRTHQKDMSWPCFQLRARDSTPRFVRPLVGRSVGWSVGWSVPILLFLFILLF